MNEIELKSLCKSLGIQPIQQYTTKQIMFNQLPKLFHDYFTQTQARNQDFLARYPFVQGWEMKFRSYLENEKLEPEYSKCSICNLIRETHLISKEYSQLICVQCILSSLNPLSRIIETYICGFGFTTKFKNELQFHLSQQECKFQPNHIKKINTNTALEIRCIQISKQGMQEITFPHSCQIFINDQQIKTLKPLELKSCQHKRRDNPIWLDQAKVKYGANNSFCVKELQPPGDCRFDKEGTKYMFGLYLVKRLQPPEAIQQIIQSQLHQKIEYFQDKIIQAFRKQEVGDCQVEKLKVSLQCQIDLQQIKIPIRGRFCKHLQCFCLEKFVHMIASQEHLKWRCIICKLPIYEFELDFYQLQIITGTKEKEVTFTPDGSFHFGKEKRLPSTDNDGFQNQCVNQGNSNQDFKTIKKQIRPIQTIQIDDDDDDDDDDDQKDSSHQLEVPPSLEPLVTKRIKIGQTFEQAIEID